MILIIIHSSLWYITYTNIFLFIHSHCLFLALLLCNFISCSFSLANSSPSILCGSIRNVKSNLLLFKMLLRINSLTCKYFRIFKRISLCLNGSKSFWMNIIFLKTWGNILSVDNFHLYSLVFKHSLFSVKNLVSFEINFRTLLWLIKKCCTS